MTTNVNFGVILEINGEDVAIEPPKAITDAKKNGVEFSLPRRVEVGTAEDLTTFITTLTDDSFSLPTAEDFPSPLDSAYEKLVSLNLAVEELYLKVPPSLNADGTPITPTRPTTFNLGLSATWSDDDTVVLIGTQDQPKLTIKGLYVKVSKT